ncbi:unnamed protein product [Acanthoscelides obtectus]|uniref:Uncharacterized protein n=1 Tax=Acanthoscelides obtectus TaxID=200917 RepID=A0A9P0MLE5_ACAOB|nr:unnamed protein product [Acanthoscelides obtectus]CAK1655629.1 Odorant receptor 85f [Acanthoscelides obtectus]
MNTGALSLIEGLIMVVGAELRTLNDSLENLKEYSESTIGVYGKGCYQLASEELDRKMIENLIDCLIKHKYIIGFLNEISFIFGKALLVQYMIIVLMLCTALFEMTKVPVGSVPFFSYICFQYCSVTGIFVLCYFGNEVIVESTRLTSSAYSCDWTGCSQTFKKLLLIFMIRSQKGLELYAANVFSISLENFLKIMKSAVSYFTVLQQFSDEMA